MNHRRIFALLGLCLCTAGALTGCSQGTPQAQPAQAPAVPVSKPVKRDVTNFVDFSGRTDAVEAVDIRARVTGYLGALSFKEGAEVKKGDQLMEIDRRPYQAQHDQAQSQVTLAQAQLKLAKQTLARDQSINSSSPGAVSKQLLDQDQAAVDEAEARVRANQSSMEVYKLNLGFTKVTSPIDGQISRYYLTPGNLVVQDQTLLTTVVSLDPMYVYFDMDEPTLQRINRAMDEGRMGKPQDGKIPIFMGLQGEEGYPHEGTINFINNQVNPTTGSISVRGVFPNPMGKGGIRLLKPGMFVRVHLPIGKPYPALLVIDRAVSSDQGLKYVYVLDAENKAQYRRVVTGALQDDGLRVIRPFQKLADGAEQGLKPDDWVVVGALQQVRPRMPVVPEQIKMPSLGSTVEPPAAGDSKE